MMNQLDAMLCVAEDVAQRREEQVRVITRGREEQVRLIDARDHERDGGVYPNAA